MKTPTDGYRWIHILHMGMLAAAAICAGIAGSIAWVIITSAAIITTGLMWRTHVIDQQRIAGLERVRVANSYTIDGLERQLARERQWRSGDRP